MQSRFTNESVLTTPKSAKIILIVGIVLLVSGIIFSINTATAYNDWSGVNSTVVSSRCERTGTGKTIKSTCKTTVSYEYRNESYTSSFSHQKPAKVPGNKLTVRVNPKNPNIIKSAERNFTPCLIFIFLGFCVTLWGVFLKQRSK